MGKQLKISEKNIANRLKQARIDAGFTTTNEFARINDTPCVINDAITRQYIAVFFRRII